MADLILYTTEDGESQFKLRADQQTVWLTQLGMAELFDASKQNISLHLKNLIEDRKLLEQPVVKDSLTTDWRAHSAATVKECLTVRLAASLLAGAGESSVARSTRPVFAEQRA